MQEVDHLTRIIEAVLHLQHALKDAGLSIGAVEIKVSDERGLGFESDAHRLNYVLKSSRKYLEMVDDPRIRLPASVIAQVAGVNFTR